MVARPGSDESLDTLLEVVDLSDRGSVEQNVKESVDHRGVIGGPRARAQEGICHA